MERKKKREARKKEGEKKKQGAKALLPRDGSQR